VRHKWCEDKHFPDSYATRTFQTPLITGPIASKSAKDGSKRSSLNQIQDPAGIFLQPYDILSFARSTDADVSSTTEKPDIVSDEPVETLPE
jgi:hypothetical protein